MTLQGYSRHFDSYYTSYSRGVSVWISDRLTFDVNKSKVDNEGRYVMIDCMINRKRYLIVILYIPPPFKLNTLRDIENFLLNCKRNMLIIVGDFNQVLCQSLDRLRGDRCLKDKLEDTTLPKYVTDVRLYDPWRCRNPYEKKFSCHSETTGSFCQIDICLCTEDLAEIERVEYLPICVSDHTPVRVCIGQRERRENNYWQINSRWLCILKDPDQILREIREFLDINKGPQVSLYYGIPLKHL